MNTIPRLITLMLVALLGAAGATAPGLAQPIGCTTIYTFGDWVIRQCATDSSVSTPMAVAINRADQGQATLIQIAHRTEAGTSTPEVAVIYASGYVRLKQGADPAVPIPFGSSFVLGPAYWSDAATYHHNPQLSRLTIDTSWLPHGPLRMQASGANADFAVAYALDLPPPRDGQTRLHVTQTFTATAPITIDPTRQAEHQGLKLAQVSSMFIPSSAACADGAQVDCRDSDGVRFIAADGARRQVAFADLSLPGLILEDPAPLGEPWLDTLHLDDAGWQGNTPNVRIALDELPADRAVTAQGYIADTTDPNDDNVGVWLHDDGLAAQAWPAGQRAAVGYWLLAQDNPPDSWADLGLRPGATFLDFEGAADCVAVDAGAPVTAAVTTIAGSTGQARQLTYDLGSTNGSWAQIRCNFAPPLDLSAYDHLRLAWRGAVASRNSIEIGLVNPSPGGDRIFGRGYHHASHHAWWSQLVVPFAFLGPWTESTTFNPAQVSAIFVSVVKDPKDDTGGAGSLAIDNLGAFNLADRSIPGYGRVSANPRAAGAAAAWLANRQLPNGLLKSWEQDTRCLAYTYDQALSLLVFSHAGMRAEADRLAQRLAATQNADGSWYQTRDCDTLEATEPPNKWEGDSAWATYALARYRAQLQRDDQPIKDAVDKGAVWLESRINLSDGCLVIDHTEATIDAWWALHTVGRTPAADQLEACLLTMYWDDAMGRFKGGKIWQQPYLDNQTWGAAFLKAIGEHTKARRALSYADAVLRVPAQGGQLFGLDGQGGPWAVWNEGTAQSIAAGGAGSADLLRELLAQQRADGAMPGAPDAFSGGGVWATRSAGVAPTAWLYHALSCSAFTPGQWAGCPTLWLPLIVREG